MTNNQLADIITEFIKHGNGRALCHRYHVDPDDAIQEIYLKLSQADLSKVTCPDRWVHRGSKHVVIDLFRRERKQQDSHQLLDEQFIGNLASEARDTPQVSKNVRAIQKLFEQLLGKEKEALMVKTGRSDESYGTLAKRYGVTKSTAAGWAVRALNKLRRWFKETM